MDRGLSNARMLDSPPEQSMRKFFSRLLRRRLRRSQTQIVIPVNPKAEPYPLA